MQHCADHDKCATTTTLMWAVGILLTVGLAICSFFSSRFSTVDAVAAIDRRLERIESKVDRMIESRAIIGRANPKKEDSAW